MRQVGSANRKYMAYMCGYHNRFGKGCCTAHYIRRPLIEQYILMDIQDMIEKAADEEKAKEDVDYDSDPKKCRHSSDLPCA